MFIKQFAFGHDSFTEEENKKVIELVKFIDLYENYEQNERLQKFKGKLQSGEKLSNNEVEELNSLSGNAISAPSTNQHKPVLDKLKDGLSSVFNSSVSASSYSGYAARNYAYDWYNDRNNADYGYYADYYNCADCWNDCTNFVSQALQAGGKTEMKDPVYTTDRFNWYYSDFKPSHSWGGAHNFYSHWKNWASLASSSSDLSVGDAVNADFGGDGHIDHTALVTYISGGNRYVTQHTADKKNAPLSNWFDNGYKVYGWEMGTDSH